MKKVMKRQAKGRVMKAKASKPKAKAKAKAAKAVKLPALPCSEKATMIPTEKVKETQCPGIKSRMSKAKNKRVSDVVHKLQYTHPSKGLVKYSVPDLRYDLKWGYVKVRSTPVIKAPKKSAKSTSSGSSRNSRSSGSSPKSKQLNLPCAATGVMTPTSKKPSCEGIRNRMKKCQGKQVAEVVGHMRYKHPAKRPDGTLLTYNLRDLRYDLKCAYLKVTGRKKRATTAAPAPRKPRSPATPVVRKGKVAQEGRQKTQKTSEKSVKDKGPERQARRRPKPSVIEEEKDLLASASDAEIEVEEPVRSRPSRRRSTAPEPSIPSTTSDRPPAPEEWPWA